MVNTDEAAYPDEYYVPLQYEVPEDGVYTFEFHSVTGLNPNSAKSGDHPSPKKAGEAWEQGKSAVAAWDITVLGKTSDDDWEVKSGRAWADYLALTTGGGEGIKSDLDVHVLTHDGYIYKVDFKEAVPHGFIFFANNTGFMSASTDESKPTTYSPIYHSFYDSTNDLDNMSSAEKVYLHKPNEDDNETQETYKIFFKKPSDELNGIEYSRNGKTEKLRTTPVSTVTISGLKFNGGDHDNVARTGHGGFFTFNADEEAIVTIRLDLRKAIFESEDTIQGEYKGSGIVEITAPVVKGSNSIYWDGKDTDGIVIPAGIYGDSNVVLASEIKHGEVHFPVIDMEGLYGGLCVERKNGPNLEEGKYNLYYNNNPLVYGTIEGEGHNKQSNGSYYELSDETRSYKPFTDRSATKSKFFTYGQNTISTLKKDDKNYLAQKMFGSNYSALSDDRKAIIDAEFGKEDDTFHLEAVNSFVTSMQFQCEGYDGGGNQSGIDAWTYYTQGVTSNLISFALMDTKERGLVKGQIFYDADISSSYDTAYGDHLLSGVKVRLIDSNNEPLIHKESLPCFDETGHFIYDSNGKIKYEEKDVKFETTTDSTGTYRFTGVPYDSSKNTTYYVQVMLSDVQSEVMRYTCTTSGDIKSKISEFIKGTIDPLIYGADGNKYSPTTDIDKKYGYKYDRKSNNETVFDVANAQSVTFGIGETSSDIVLIKEFKKIGFGSTVPVANQKDYKVKKEWGTDSHGNPTHKISDGLIVELWVWNDEHVKEDNSLELSRRTGALMDTQVLNEENSWTYTWENLDDRLQYYVLEYYTKKKSDGEIIYNDKGEPRKVLIGGTMPVFGATSSVPDSGIYGFKTNLGDYPEATEIPLGSGEIRIPIQKFGDGIKHTNAITKKEKLESVDNNARQYNVTYTLTKEDGDKTNVFNITNSQAYDDRTYYVWLDHQTKLPEMIAQTYLDGGVRGSHALTLSKDTNHKLDDGTFWIKGLSVSSLDAAKSDNAEGNATNAFRISEDGNNYALFTATNHGNYKTGTGTRTYQVKYVVDSSTKNPVSVIANDDGELVLWDNHSTKVEKVSTYTVYSWYMTIHVYDVAPDDVIEYNPYGGAIVLQEPLRPGEELKWTLTHNGKDYNSISYTSNDRRTSGLFKNDIYRLPLYKSATNPDMGSCADIVGIAYAGSEPVDDVSKLTFEDTYASQYGTQSSDKDREDGKAIAQGSRGFVEVDLKTKRDTRINRTQDHANYAKVTFTPGKNTMARAASSGEDVFYYKIVVFAEDNTYQYHSYDKIDASEGVEMYTYFTMKPNVTIPPGGGDTKDKKPKTDKKSNDINTVLNPNIEDASIIRVGSASPKTGDRNHLVLWLCIALFAMSLITFGASKKKIKMTKVMTPAICTVGAVLFVYAGYMLMTQLNDYLDSLSLYEKTEKKYVFSKEEEKISQSENDWKDLVNVDLSSLRKINEDIAGWIYFENEDISYPVLHAEDDETYLRKTYTGETSSAGSIFIEGNNSSDFSDAHTIIYGHDMKNKSMFGRLKYYLRDKDYIADHDYFQIITEGQKLRYKIFSYKVVADDSDIYTVYKVGSVDFLDFVKNSIQSGNYMQNDENIKLDDHLITLSTCLNDDRLVITAVRCDEFTMR